MPRCFKLKSLLHLGAFDSSSRPHPLATAKTTQKYHPLVSNPITPSSDSEAVENPAMNRTKLSTCSPHMSPKKGDPSWQTHMDSENANTLFLYKPVLWSFAGQGDSTVRPNHAGLHPTRRPLVGPHQGHFHVQWTWSLSFAPRKTLEKGVRTYLFL